MSQEFRSLTVKFAELNDEGWLLFNSVAKQLERGDPEHAVLGALQLGVQHPELALELAAYLEERIGFERADRELYTDLHAAADIARSGRGQSGSAAPKP